MTTPPLLDPSVHNAARDVLERGGWAQHYMGHPALIDDHPHCLAGAYRAVTCGPAVIRSRRYTWHQYLTLLDAVIVRHWPERLTRVFSRTPLPASGDVTMCFNDHPDTTLDDVLHAIKYAEEAE